MTGIENFLFSRTSRMALRPNQPPVQWIMGALSPEVKQTGCEAGSCCSLPSVAEFKTPFSCMPS
jgi:hypothetical protein